MRGSVAVLLVAVSTAQTLPNTQPLERTGDLAMEMVAAIDSWLSRRLAASPSRRSAPSPALRTELRELIGAQDARLAFASPAVDATLTRAATLGATPAYEVVAIRWPVFPNVDGEGLLLKPRHREPLAHVIALPDASQSPEEFAASTLVRQLAESGALVVIPLLMDRDDSLSGNPAIRFTNQPHREFLYRMSYELGRHIIGYEVQKVLAVVDWFARLPKRPVGLYGYGEGGMLALFAAALDARIDATVVSGYFEPREAVIWSQPIYRNVWGLVEQFGDAELARLVAPRTLVVETKAPPVVTGPPPARDNRRGAAPGVIQAPAPDAIARELERARRYHPQIIAVASAAEPFLQALQLRAAPPRHALAISHPEPAARRARQFHQLVDHTQRLMRLSEFRRREFFAGFDASRPTPYREKLHDVLGRMPTANQPLVAQTRQIYDTAHFTGFEVLLPVWDEVFAYGILLLPKDMKPGERRPAVVCQHGLEGRPQDVIAASDERTRSVYANFAAALAERGFIVFAPQNPYIGKDAFRVLQRKANPQKLSLFSFIIGQHARILDWLVTLPGVDPARIGFYGLSYGGKTAMRVPAIETRYALSICSGDFNEWIWKNVSIDYPFTYMFTGEYEMPEFNLGMTFNYAEMAYLIAPRPFMVERGHRDGVGIDEWVNLEFAKVRRHYVNLNVAERTEIEHFNGPHQIHGVGAYDFLHRHLSWPKRTRRD
jgi:dienelactone hydrolase